MTNHDHGLLNDFLCQEEYIAKERYEDIEKFLSINTM